jgi:hypothetical protein
MRAILLAALLIALPTCVPAQNSSTHFVFNGHQVGEAKDAGTSWSKCTNDREHHKSMCTRERELLEGVALDVGYTYLNDRLAGVSFLVDSVGFDGVLPALIKRYGAPSRLVRARGRDYAEWRFKEGRLHLTRTGSRANEVVFATFASAE